MLSGESAAEISPHQVYRLSEHFAVGARKIDQLKDTAPVWLGRQWGEVVDSTILDAHPLAGL